ncbi:MAG: iron-containing alcohol dehydrogenase [Betaproteobacteria bacterium]|nr:iron-containing alcohol dehydrogenase [Betaproteobacteria bacterium]
MVPFTHGFPQQQVLFGRGSASDLREPLERLGVARPLVVCSPRAASGPHVAAIVARLPGTAQVWPGVQTHAPLESALRGAEVARLHRADGIVSFGGGSASDLAKGVALALAEGPGIESLALRRDRGASPARVRTAPMLPLVALPTTLSGAEVTPGFSLTRSDAYKLIFRDSALAARLIVLDPLLLADAPERMLVGSGMNALAHCFEALYSKARTPISSLLAVDGLQRLWRGLEQRAGGNASADELLLGAYLAGAAIVNARTALHHAICHKLAPLADTSHGEANTAVLPHVLAFNLPYCPGETVRMAQAMGISAADEPAASLVAEITTRLSALALRAGLQTRLRELGLDRSQLDELARRVFTEPGLAFNPAEIHSAEQIHELLCRAW